VKTHPRGGFHASSSVWVLVALAAMLVAAANPRPGQLRRTLKAAQQTLENDRRQVSQTIDRLTVTLERVEVGPQSSSKTASGRVKSLFRRWEGIGDALPEDPFVGARRRLDRIGPRERAARRLSGSSRVKAARRRNGQEPLGHGEHAG